MLHYQIRKTNNNIIKDVNEELITGKSNDVENVDVLKMNSKRMHVCVRMDDASTYLFIHILNFN